MRLPGPHTWLGLSTSLVLGCGSIGGSAVLDPPDAAPSGGGGNEIDAAPAMCGDAVFKLTTTQDEFLVPDAVSFLHIKAWGAGGNGQSLPGGIGPCGYDDGGLGGFTEAVFPVVPGEPLMIIVGERGRAGLTGEQIQKFGFGQWGGGGLSGVFRGPDLITEIDGTKALAIAGGGGSANAYDCEPGGTGNHADAGGMPSMLGGVGGNTPDPTNGGAGGYTGGLGGDGRHRSLGGKGYVDPSAIDQQILASEPGTGVPPKTDDPDYADDAGKTETSGRVVLHFECEAGQIE